VAVPGESLDANKLLVLGEWAQGLRRDERPEVAAAGRAILMLVEEIERLHVALWSQRLDGVPPPLEPVAATPESDDANLEQTIRERLVGRFRDASSPG
jgi:hypothetical protein